MAAVVGGYAEALIVEWLGSQGSAMLAALREMVDTDGGTYDKAGVDAVGAQVRRFLEAQGIAVETVPRATYGDCLKARVEGDGARRRAGGGGNARRWIVLMGHRDTVFPKGEPERRPFRVEGGRAYGPGVADMKAGLVMNMFVLAAFKRFGGAPAPLLGLFTGDEEIGSPEGREVIEGVAREARAVFNAEPGRPSGGVITGRKGGVFSFFEIEGKAAHSGGNFEAGVSAIEELARKVQALHAITDLKRGITVNVGLVNGGQSVNTVAPYATGQIDLRYVEPQDREEAMARIHDDRRPLLRARHARQALHPGRVPAADAEPGERAAVRGLPRGGGGERARHPGRVLRRLRRFRLHRGGRRADALRDRPGRRQGAQPGGVPGDRDHGAPRPGPGAGDPPDRRDGRLRRRLSPGAACSARP